MTPIRMLSLVLLACMAAGCDSTRWVHPTKNEDRLAADMMACDREFQNMIVTNPGVASVHTNQTIVRQRMDGCLQKKGWRKIEDK